VLLARESRFERLATVRPIRLAGGDSAIREVWRIAAALLDDAFDGQIPLERFPLFREIRPEDLRVVRAMARRGVHAPLARGVGRYFDGIGALVLGRKTSTFEGQTALAWNLVADPSESRDYPRTIDRSSLPWTLDLRPLVRAVAQDVLAGAPPAEISGRFHNALANATAELVRACLERVGPLPVVLTGGCFQNALLAERVAGALGRSVRVSLHRDVPPGDGGIALGQALVARERSRAGEER
jgi:hydrogenase maturation protein HypF